MFVAGSEFHILKLSIEIPLCQFVTSYFMVTSIRLLSHLFDKETQLVKPSNCQTTQWITLV